MPQLNFEQNIYNTPGAINIGNISDRTLSFVPFNVRDSISFNNINLLIAPNGNANRTHTFSLGLYSITGSTLSLANSASQSISMNTATNDLFYLSISNTSATQNITPGSWWFGILVATGGDSGLQLRGASGIGASASNAFPGSFIGGRMTASTVALPASMATSDLDITGLDAMWVPYILLAA